ncbi:MAG: hypothetical protein JWP64_3092, partial [Pseudonocardia sp.]|nr:hypothetical protein [Pseudonocardia sp.]
MSTSTNGSAPLRVLVAGESWI